MHSDTWNPLAKGYIPSMGYIPLGRGRLFFYLSMKRSVECFPFAWYISFYELIERCKPLKSFLFAGQHEQDT
jgi:hypothetical protein